jgi:hypothetical protein
MDFMPFDELSQIVEGKSVRQHMDYYRTNVLYLGTMSHEEFEKEFPQATVIIEKIDLKIARLQKLLEE